jgi:RNA polymerase sigma-70 factor (ECF subfamily)
MANHSTSDTEELLALAAAGSDEAMQKLFLRHRERLRRMVAARVDPRLAARFDPSDVLQDAWLDAFRKLPRYLEERPLPFYPWLRRLTLERLAELHRRHVIARKRDPRFEVSLNDEVSDASAWQLAERLSASGNVCPGAQAIREEANQRVREALARLRPDDREILILRYLEQLSTDETAAALGISESAAKMRHLRALERIRTLLQRSS